MPVVTYPKGPRKSYSLFVLAILLLLFGGVAFALGGHDFTIRTLGLLAIVASTYLVRMSNVRDATGPAPGLKIDQDPGRMLWVISIALVPLLVASFFLLHVDALNGGHDAWPVYLFAGVVLVCAGVWGALVARIGSQ